MSCLNRTATDERPSPASPLLQSGQMGEHDFHRIDARKVHARVMIAAPLAFRKTKTAPRVEIAGPRAAQMNHGSQVQLPLRRSGRDSIAGQGTPYMQIEVGRSELDRVARHHANIEAVEPA